jgi:3-oxoacyl-[acyl-carrier-protein] synthase III
MSAANTGATALSTPHIHAISFTVGERESISMLPAVVESPDLQARMLDLGIRHYRRSSDSAVQLAYSSISQTMALSPIAADDIDAMVYASADPDALSADSVLSLLESAGLTRATPVGISLSNCGNFGSALRVAHTLLADGGSNNVLVVTTDVCTDPAQRILTDTLSVLSDGAASCILSGTTASGISVLATGQRTDQRVRTAKSTEQLPLVRRGLSKLVSDVLERAGLRPTDVGLLITNNVNCEAIRFMGVAMGLSYDICYVDNVADYGHVHSADVLINLFTHLEDGVMSRQSVVTVSHSYGTWGAAVIQIAL